MYDNVACKNCGCQGRDHVRLEQTPKGRFKERQGKDRYGRCRPCEFFGQPICNEFVPVQEAVHA